MPEPDEVLDAGLRRHARMLRVANGVSRRALSTLAEGEAVVAAYVERRLEKLVRRGIMLSRTTRDQITSIIRGAALRSRKVFRVIVSLVRDAALEAGQLEAAMEAASISRILARDVPAPPRSDVRAALLRAPVAEGRTLRQMAAGLAKGHADAVERGVRAGVALGEPARAISRRIFGTAAAGGRDGLAHTVRRALGDLVETAFTHAAGVARFLVYSSSPDIVKGYEWIITLDNKTCASCLFRARRGPYEVGKAPLPPEHRNCRCVLAPVLAGFDDLEVPDYEDWLRRQTADVQREVLGPTRHRLWRSGRVRLDRFVNDRGRVLTLAELERRENLPDLRVAA
jgi:hypothetical protein